MPTQNGPEYSISPEGVTEVVSETDAQDVLATAQEWAEQTGSAIGELHPSQRPGFLVRVLENSVRIDTDRAGVNRAAVYERGEQFKLFPMGSAVYATTDSDFLNDADARIAVEQLSMGVSYEETVQTQPIVRAQDTPLGRVREDFYPSGADSELVIAARAVGGPIEAEVWFNEIATSGEGVPPTVIRKPSDNPRLTAQDGEMIFVTMDLASYGQVRVYFNEVNGDQNVQKYTVTMR